MIKADASYLKDKVVEVFVDCDKTRKEAIDSIIRLTPEEAFNLHVQLGEILKCTDCPCFEAGIEQDR